MMKKIFLTMIALSFLSLSCGSGGGSSNDIYAQEEPPVTCEAFGCSEYCTICYVKHPDGGTYAGYCVDQGQVCDLEE